MAFAACLCAGLPMGSLRSSFIPAGRLGKTPLSPRSFIVKGIGPRRQGFASPLRALDGERADGEMTRCLRGERGDRARWGARTGCQASIGLANAGRHQPKVATPRPRYLVRGTGLPRLTAIGPSRELSRGRCRFNVARGCSPQRAQVVNTATNPLELIATVNWK